MTGRVSNSLSFGRKLLLIAAGTIAIAGPIVIGLTNPPPSRARSAPPAGTPHVTFDVTSIKPERGGMQFFRIGMDAGRFTATNATLKTLIQIAYRVKDSQISGAPGWTNPNITISRPSWTTPRPIRNGKAAPTIRTHNSC